MTLIGLNLFLVGLLALQAFVVLAVSIYFEPDHGTVADVGTDRSKRYYSAFLLFWALAWTVEVFDWIEVLFRNQWGRQIWLNWTIDTTADFFFVAAAYVLFRGAQFEWNDRYLKTAFALLPAAILIVAVPSLLVSRENLFWRFFLLPADVLMAVVAFFAVGIAIFRELRDTASHVRWTVLIVFVGYAFLQFPNLPQQAADPQIEDPLRSILRTIFAISKVALFFAMIATLASFYRASLGVRLLKSVRMGSLILGTAISLLLVYFHLRELIRSALAG